MIFFFSFNGKSTKTENFSQVARRRSGKATNNYATNKSTTKNEQRQRQRGYKLNVCQRQNYTNTHAHVHVYTLPYEHMYNGKKLSALLLSARGIRVAHTHTRVCICVCMYIAYIYCTYAAGLYKTGLSPCCCRWRRCRFIRALNVGPCGSLSACGASANRKKNK